MLRHLLLLLCTLALAPAAPSVLQALPSVPVTPFVPPQDQVTRFFNQPLHDDYAISETTFHDKLGWMSFDLEMTTMDKAKVLRVLEVCEFRYLLENVPFLQQSRQEYLFDAQPPYALRRASLEESLQKSQRSTVLTRIGNGEYRAVIQEHGTTRTRDLTNLQLTALDRLGPRLWATGLTRQRGDCQAFRAFDLKTLQPYTERYCVRIPAAAAQFVEVTSEDQKDHFTSHWKLHLSGEVESVLIADATFLQRQTRTEARSAPAAFDVLTHSFLQCDRPLGPAARRLPAMELHLSGTDFRNVTSTSNQQVTLNATGTEAVFRTGPNRAPATPASPKEIKLNLAATVPIPCDDPRLQKLAATATNKATSEVAKVKQLLQFVSDYIKDDDRVKTLSVFEILEKPRGDCTAHALLFTCLARAAGIPCREASGYIYLGDEQQKFGGHAWNEVVLGGVWHPVDPTWNQFHLDPTHLQLSTGHPTPRDARFFNGKIKIHVPE